MGLRQAHIRYIHDRVYPKKNCKSTNISTPVNLSIPHNPTAPRKYGAASQEPTPQDTAPPTTKEEITRIQQVVGSILYYSRAVELTVIMALSTITSEQAKATKTTLKNVHQVLDYLATNIDAMIRFHASDMVLNIH